MRTVSGKPFENACFVHPFATLDGANSPKPPLYLTCKNIIPPPAKFWSTFYFVYVNMVTILIT